MRVKGKAVRILKRVMGEKAGGVLMEYVVLGLLVVAAVAVAVIGFGDSIRNAFTGMSKVAVGDVVGAEKHLKDTARPATDAQNTAGEGYSRRISNQAGE